MSEPANFDSLQARLRGAAVEEIRCAVLRRLLAEFDPLHNHTALSYAALLQRAHAILTTALDAPTPESSAVTRAVEEAKQILTDAKEGE